MAKKSLDLIFVHPTTVITTGRNTLLKSCIVAFQTDGPNARGDIKQVGLAIADAAVALKLAKLFRDMAGHFAAGDVLAKALKKVTPSKPKETKKKVKK